MSPLIPLIVLSVLSATVAGLPATAQAQKMEPITLVGYFDRTIQDHPQITDEITLSTDGKTRRPFGFVRVQSRIGVAGADVFKISLNPIVLVRGPEEMIAKLDAAGPTQRVKMIGMLNAGTKGIVLTGVEVAAPPSTSGTGETPAESSAGKE